MQYTVDEYGYYGRFGGAFVPEILQANIAALKAAFRRYKDDPAFCAEFEQLLKDYVGRPSPLYRAQRLSDFYKTNIYLKREDLNHTGAHKINNTIGQILLAKRMGKTHVIAETGAGQHGVATATVCALMDIRCTVFMGATDIERQRPNVERMQLLGAAVEAVHSGSKTLKDAANEAIRYWIAHPADTHYIIGSVIGPDPYPEMVTHFQQVISREMRAQLKEKTGSELPAAVIACVGGGSNAAGAFYHFLDDADVALIAVEAAGRGISSGETAATIATGTEGIIHGSRTLLMQTADGQIVEPYSISAGLDYPGIGPLHAHLHISGRARFLAATDGQALDAAFRLMQLEGIIPALESAHALAALDQLSFGSQDHIVLCLSGRGDKDLAAYHTAAAERSAAAAFAYQHFSL
ncbi:tryptophan synthase subunit beta [Taibaiella chishuiensis]|uniref:Tryptophan synthase beta chain n=1 Tax=Taibaiella chishuiensis TaxID=1434707 RepID=A0A2P8D5S8_9BACT|nr:tryptophan synthase subunit beta [Taibaiella chishuiensis]PSK92558.1 tryptophan synthase beta chain [Taibaiella chishuiensis]